MIQPNTPGLPLPSSAEQEHSDELQSTIRGVIDDAGGLITFSRFMELALYSPLGGYYAAGSQKFGEHGDFITAPELGNVFAQCLGRQVAQVLNWLDGGEIMEIGAGSGVLALQLLHTLAAQDRLPKHYFILEASADLARRQHELLVKHIPQIVSRVRWLTELPDQFDGVILANEVADAMPVDRFKILNGQVHGIGVAWGTNGFTDATYIVDDATWDTISNLNLPEGYSSEAGFQRQAWMQTIGECLQTGVVIVVDYGFPHHEYFHPQRSSGTLMCHYRHRSHFDPYVYVGLQDITAHVDFTALAESAVVSGLSLLGFTTQASFLLSLGILDVIEPIMQANAAEKIAITQEVKKLTLPSEMGELFKVMAAGKGIHHPLTGFTQTDHRGRL